ncbi:unnamed protein product [Durusdinium trenchii]
MAAISGLELAVHTSHAGQQKQVHVVGVEVFRLHGPLHHTQGWFAHRQRWRCRPLCGYGLAWLWRSARVMHGYEWIFPHLARKRFKKLKDWRTQVRHPKGEEASFAKNFGCSTMPVMEKFPPSSCNTGAPTRLCDCSRS